MSFWNNKSFLLWFVECQKAVVQMLGLDLCFLQYCRQMVEQDHQSSHQVWLAVWLPFYTTCSSWPLGQDPCYEKKTFLHYFRGKIQAACFCVNSTLIYVQISACFFLGIFKGVVVFQFFLVFHKKLLCSTKRIFVLLFSIVFQHFCACFIKDFCVLEKKCVLYF